MFVLCGNDVSVGDILHVYIDGRLSSQLANGSHSDPLMLLPNKVQCQVV